MVAAKRHDDEDKMIQMMTNPAAMKIFDGILEPIIQLIDNDIDLLAEPVSIQTLLLTHTNEQVQHRMARIIKKDQESDEDGQMVKLIA